MQVGRECTHVHMYRHTCVSTHTHTYDIEKAAKGENQATQKWVASKGRVLWGLHTRVMDTQSQIGLQSLLDSKTSGPFLSLYPVHPKPGPVKAVHIAGMEDTLRSPYNHPR